MAREQTTKKTPPNDVITGTDPKENIVSDPLLLHDVITGTDPKENIHCCIGCCCVFIRCDSNGCQHMLYCLQHARHNTVIQKYFFLEIRINIKAGRVK
jgi:hypothetical protein